MVKKLSNCFPSDEKLNTAISSLVDLINHQFQTSDPTMLETTLMVWRAGLILLSFPQMNEWEWS